MSEKRKVVIDTNILISGIFWGGIPSKVLEKWELNEFEVFISLDILEEYLEVIERISKAKSLKDEWKSYIVKNSKIIEVSDKPKVSRDINDDKFIWCALAAKADFIVTGDMDLLILEQFKTITILKPREFLQEISR